jgi:hypothetical protein
VPFYGEAAGAELTSLLQEHIAIAVELVTAAKRGDAAAVADASTRWYANADDIASFLASANPAWPLDELRDMMRLHLDQTLGEASARLAGDFAQDVALYGRASSHILMMADALSDGIARQFPGLVGDDGTVAPGEEELHVAMRELWREHVQWTRFYLIEAIAGLDAAGATAGRLLQNQVDIGNAIKPFYGDAAGEALSSLLRDHITIAVELVTAARAGDRAALEDAQTRWYANADDVATFLANANPAWPLDDLRAMMRAHLDQTLAEATARLTGDWAGDVVIYDKIEQHILEMADALTAGIAEQFPQKLQ